MPTRLSRVAREAAMQCRRVACRRSTAVADFADVASRARRRSGRAPAAAARRSPRPTVLVGPEGGWAPEERDADLPAVGLGDHVLRAETAAIAAGVLLAGLRSGSGSRRPDRRLSRPTATLREVRDRLAARTVVARERHPTCIVSTRGPLLEATS